MRLGFLSAHVPEDTLEQVLNLAHKAGVSNVELVFWPPEQAQRRYGGVFHIDMTDLSIDAGDAGDVAIEVEDRPFEGSLESRLDALHINQRHLLQCIQG
jgi:hypothetical protein